MTPKDPMHPFPASPAVISGKTVQHRNQESDTKTALFIVLGYVWTHFLHAWCLVLYNFITFVGS